MATTVTSPRIEIKDVLFLTDFSDIANSALPFAKGIAKRYGATIHALNILIPQNYTYATPELGTLALEGQEQAATEEMKRLESRISDVPHDVRVVCASSIWPVVEESVNMSSIDLIVLATQGRSGVARLLMGSSAEEILRRSPVPVITVGPLVPKGKAEQPLGSVLFATDFSTQSNAAVPWAISLANESRVPLVLLHVIAKRASEPAASSQLSVAEALHNLHELVPQETQLLSRPEAIVRYGEPATAILTAAEEKGSGLIVLGVRGAEGVPGAAVHLESPVTHRVVAQARCPVLTVRS